MEVINLALALDVDYGSAPVPELEWADSTPASVIGGNTLFSANSVVTEWKRTGGIASGIVVSSLGSTVFSDNVCTMTTENSYGSVGFEWAVPEKPVTSMRQDVMSGADKMAFVMAHVYIGGASTVQANGNRFVEGDVDALFSAWFASALQPADAGSAALRHGLVAFGNVGSHCMLRHAVFPHLDHLLDNITVYNDDATLGCDLTITPNSLSDVRVLQASS